MSAELDEIAARWHLAQASDDMDWAAFTQWLEADPRHRDAYDAIALLDARIDGARPQLAERLSEPQISKQRSVRKIAGWSAVAAGVLALAAVGVGRLPADRSVETATYEAPAGQSRTVSFADGSRATLAAGSVLRVREGGSVTAELDGKAYFDVRHDPDRIFIVRAGAYEIRDLGTRFDITMAPEMISIAVGEGTVAVRPAGGQGEVTVDAGRALTMSRGAVGSLASIRPLSVGAWRAGPLAYEDVPLGLVVADIARATGETVEIDPELATRRFAGVIAPGDRAAMTSALAQMTGLHVRNEGNATRISNAARR